VLVTFTPTHSGPSGVFSLPILPVPAHGDTTLVCSATARDPERRVDHLSSFDFRRVCIGSTQTASLAIVTNTGELPVAVTVPASTSGQFTWPALSTTLAPCATPPSAAIINVAFAPTTPGPHAATLTVVTNAPGAAAVNIALTGTGAPLEAVIRIDGASFDFGRVMPQACAQSCFTVSNDGCATMLLVLTSSGDPLLASGGDPFFVSDGSAMLPTDTRLITTIGGLSAHEFCVTFNPQAEGAASYDLIVASNDLLQPSIRFPMSGVGEIRAPVVRDWTYNVRIFGQQSKAAPALAEFERKLHLVHLGDSSNNIWWSTYNGSSWSPNVVIPGQKSKVAPALAVFGGMLHMVHLGDTSNRLWWSVFDARTGVWSVNDYLRDGQESRDSVGLAQYIAGCKLVMVHTGTSSTNLWYSTYPRDGRNP
jgi:hypothetical protein